MVRTYIRVRPTKLIVGVFWFENAISNWLVYDICIYIENIRMENPIKHS
jgi:hypothetical protein